MNKTEFNHIATSLSKHFDSLYYVEIETGDFNEFVSSNMFSKLDIPKQGNDFFKLSAENAKKIVHPDDVENLVRIFDKTSILRLLSQNDSYSVTYRLIIDGKIVHVRLIYIMCSDRKHVLCCLENIENEFQEKAEQEKNLQSAERMARLDELTGIKNKNAFTEYSQSLDDKIKSGVKGFCFGVVMCDMNDLKLLNDTRGHNFGDESIRRASRMICDVFKHSPVFRIGGDEFVVILTNSDYEHREQLLQALRDDSLANRISRSGPEVACGLAVYDSESDKNFSEVFERADRAMYENKKIIKSYKLMEDFRKMDSLDKIIPAERKRLLDSLFGALYTIAGEGYIYLNDMRYDYSRWALSLIDDFGLESEYMYHAERIWQDYVHPDDVKAYREAVDAVLRGNAEVRSVYYRARKADGTYVLLTTRGFVLTDNEGNPEYFGGIILPQ